MTAKEKKTIDSAEFLGTLAEQAIDLMERSLRGAFQKQREVLVRELELRLTQLSSPGRETISAAVALAKEEWIGIESLSRLRGLVGGRFQNIKKKWVDAGFPLREHRGDRLQDFAVEEAAWVDLTNWILKHGYEARLSPDSKEFLFELRKVGGEK